MPVSYCSGCKRTFSSTSAFDLHRVGNFTHNQRHCLMPHEMSTRGIMRRDDCDLEKGLIEIRRSVAYLVDEYIEGPPKTERSERTIPISPTVCALLKKHRIRQNEERLKVGEKWQDKNIVYCNQTGGYVYSNTFRKGFASLLDKAGLPSMHIHDLRHTASTLMQSLGVSPKAVQEMLGHSHLSQTGEYTHVLLSMQQQASERFEDLPMIIFPENTHLKIEQVSL